MNTVKTLEQTIRPIIEKRGILKALNRDKVANLHQQDCHICGLLNKSSAQFGAEDLKKMQDIAYEKKYYAAACILGSKRLEALLQKQK